MEQNSRQKFENAPYTDLNLYVDHPVTDALFDQLIHTLSKQYPNRTRMGTRNQAETAIIAILSNLLRANWSGARVTAISLARTTYIQEDTDSVGFKAIKTALEFLSSPQIFEDRSISSIISVHKGFMSSSGYRENSKLELNPKPLCDWISISLKNNSQYKDINITRFVEEGIIVYKSTNNETIDNEHINYITPITSTLKPRFLTRKDKSPIRLTDENGRRIEFLESSETSRMSLEIDAYNDFLARHKIGLFLSDDEFDALLAATRSKLIERGVGRDFVYTHAQLRGWQTNRLHRVFNRSSLTCGGRHYGGSWQNTPKGYRPFITIDGHPTVELDYSSLHPTMIYHQRDLEPVGDPYSIEGVPNEYRNSVKRAFLVLINASPKARHLESLDGLPLPEDWNVPRLTRAIEDKHFQVADAFRSDSGVRLQRLDSDMASFIMREMRVRHNALVLPVHDSFIVTEDQEANLKSVMLKAYSNVMGSGSVRIDRKQAIFECLGDTEENSGPARLLRYIEGVMDTHGSIFDPDSIETALPIAKSYSQYVSTLQFKAAVDVPYCEISHHFELELAQ